MPVSVETYQTVEEARGATTARGARIFGGGTLLMRAVNDADPSVERLIRIQDPALRRIESRGDRVVLGAGATMSDILAHRDLAFLAPAARAVGGPAIRNMATVGGNLFAEPPYGDLAVALLALGAHARLANDFSGRETPLEDLFGQRGREPRPFVTEISIPRPAADAFRFLKATRVKPKGVSLMTIAALLPMRGGRVSSARVAYGAMGPTPLRAPAVERALEGRSLDPSGVAAALAAASEGLAPPTDALASDWYRREVAPTHLRRLLLGDGR